MKKYILIAAICVILIVSIVIICVFYGKPLPSDPSKSEPYSYHFGFPTWGNVNNHIPIGVIPFIHRPDPEPYYDYSMGIWRFYNPVSEYDPYSNGSKQSNCYNTNHRRENCVPGYMKRSHFDKNTGDEAFQCCKVYF